MPATTDPSVPRAAAPARLDGRTARRDRNRDAVIDAVVDLFGEGKLALKPEEVAARSRVSLRSVYRYFSDRTALAEVAMDRNFQRLLPFLTLEAIGEGGLDDRIEGFVAARLRLYEAARPVVRVARSIAEENPTFIERYQERTALLTDQFARHFEPELERLPAEEARRTVDAGDALTQFDAVEFLRVTRGLSDEETAAALRHGLGALLRPVRTV